MDATASTAAQLRHTDSGPSTPSIPLRLLRRSGSSQGSGGSSKYAGGTGPRTLMFFKGCPRPLGCTVLLQGADAEQLTLLKKVMKVVIVTTVVIIVVMMIIMINVSSHNSNSCSRDKDENDGEGKSVWKAWVVLQRQCGQSL